MTIVNGQSPFLRMIEKVLGLGFPKPWQKSMGGCHSFAWSRKYWGLDFWNHDESQWAVTIPLYDRESAGAWISETMMVVNGWSPFLLMFKKVPGLGFQIKSQWSVSFPSHDRECDRAWISETMTKVNGQYPFLRMIENVTGLGDPIDSETGCNETAVLTSNPLLNMIIRLVLVPHIRAEMALPQWRTICLCQLRSFLSCYYHHKYAFSSSVLFTLSFT